MSCRNALLSACLLVTCCVVPMSAQQPAASASNRSNVVVPPLVNFSGVLSDGNGKPLSVISGVTFLLYKEEVGGAPLWMETQNVYPDKTGHYAVMLGSTTSTGLPADIFVAGEARWLAVQPQGQAEKPRILLLSVPYALKAADAQTVGGLPASAFVLAAPPSATSASAVGSIAVQPLTVGTTPVTTAGGTINKLAKFDAAADITNSQIFDNGTSVGIGNTAPGAKLDVSGAAIVRGLLTLPATGVATATAGKNSQPIGWTASAFNSGTATAVNQIFRWQAEPAGNNTATTSGTLNLLYAIGTATPGETGLKIGSNGRIIFAAGQTFPGTGTGNGTITGVTAGTDLTGGGSAGKVTLNLDITKVPQLATANTFTGNQTVNGNLSATGLVTGSAFNIGSNFFAIGAWENGNAFLGFAGNTTTPSTGNTGSGWAALKAVTTGGENTASGYEALNVNTTGSYNTASGFWALSANVAGIANTATGWGALYSNTASNNTAHGFRALFSNTTGSYNTAEGNQSLTSNTVASYNAAVGFEALYSNVGDSAQDGWYNTAVGYQALFSNNNTSGTGLYAGLNTAIGASALYSNTTGNGNTASGYEALQFNTTGGYNTADGYRALYNTTGQFNTGGWNTGLGANTLQANTTGSYNNATGASALEANTTGNGNTADGVLALDHNTTGADNTAVGYFALSTNQTGSTLTCVGYNCGTSAASLSNATAIGAHAVVGASNSLVLGGTGQYAVKVGIGTETPSNVLTIAQGAGQPLSDGWATFSSRRWKTNIQPLHGALEKVEQLRGVSYDLKANGKHEVGVIAEEVGAIVPEVVTWEKNGTDAQSVDYGRLTALLIEATKEQQALIREQKEQISVQQGQIARLTRQVKTIEATLKASRRSDGTVRTAQAGGTKLRQ